MQCATIQTEVWGCIELSTPVISNEYVSCGVEVYHVGKTSTSYFSTTVSFIQKNSTTASLQRLNF